MTKKLTKKAAAGDPAALAAVAQITKANAKKNAAPALSTWTVAHQASVADSANKPPELLPNVTTGDAALNAGAAPLTDLQTAALPISKVGSMQESIGNQVGLVSSGGGVQRAAPLEDAGPGPASTHQTFTMPVVAAIVAGIIVATLVGGKAA